MAKHGRRRRGIAFDFVVYERPKYVPGSGPPLQPIDVLPANDRDGFIEDYISGSENSLPRYIVGYEDEPQLKVTVRPQNILDWVSARTYENFEHERSLRTAREAEEALLRRIREKDERKELKLKMREEARSRGQISRTTTPDKKRRGRPPGSGKKFAVVIPSPSPKRRRLSSEIEATEDEEPTPRVPSFSHPSLSQPSLSTPSRQRGLAEIVIASSETEEDEVDMEDALNAQIYGSMAAAPSHGRILDSSPGPLNLGRSLSQTTSMGEQDSMPSLSDKARQLNAEDYVYNPLHSTGSKKHQRSSDDLPMENSHKKPRSNSASQPRFINTIDISDDEDTPRAPRHTKHSTHAEHDPTTNGVGDAIEDKNGDVEFPEEPEWDVRGILDHQTKRIDGQRVTYYLIDWEGDYDPSWEPAENIDDEMIRDYKRSAKYRDMKEKKRSAKRLFKFDGAGDKDELKGVDNRRGSIGYESDPEALFVGPPEQGHSLQGGADKGGEVFRGQVGDDGETEEDADEAEKVPQWSQGSLL